MAEIDAKKFYNEVMPTKQGADYEYARWHKNGIAEAGYQQTKETVSQFLNEKHAATNILELGPGAGTWSLLLREQYPEIKMTLTDISSEMLTRSEKLLGTDNITYVESSFKDFHPQESFDLFLSSRVIEYMEDKNVFAQNLHAVLSDGAQGLIITKMPHYGRMKLMGKKVSSFHTSQVKPSILTNQLQDAGLKVISIYPVTVSVPFLNSTFLNRLAGKIIKMVPVNFITAQFTESYAVVFRK